MKKKTNKKNSKNLWSGRFVESPSETMLRINSSINFDKILYIKDISTSKCRLLNKTAIAEKPKKKEKPKVSPDDDKIVPAGSGSGFFVSKDGHAITNYHVIEGCDINKLSFKGSQTEVKVLAVDKVNDIAILKSNAKPDVIFPVSNEDVSLLELSLIHI